MFWLSLPSGQITLRNITNFNWANLIIAGIIAVCLTLRSPFLCFLFRTGTDLWWFSAMLCHALFSGCWIFSDSELLIRIYMVKNFGVCRSERRLPHDVKCHFFLFFSLWRVENHILPPCVTLRGHDLFAAPFSWGYFFRSCILKYRIWSLQFAAFSLVPRTKDHDVQMMNLYWKESVSLFLNAVISRFVCRMFQIHELFFYDVFACSVYYWILFRPIAANGCHQKHIQPLLISSILPPSLFCFGFDLNQSQRAKPISRNGYGRTVEGNLKHGGYIGRLKVHCRNSFCFFIRLSSNFAG